MTQSAIDTLDDLDEGHSVVEVDWRHWMQDVRTTVGVYDGFERAGQHWYLVVRGKLTVRTIDVIDVRKLKQLETSEQAGRPQ